MYRQSEKNLLSSNISPTCPHNMVNFGPLAAEILLLVWGTPGNFNGFCILAALLHGTLVVGVSKPRRWTEGATYIRQSGHHVGHWPTFLVHHSNSSQIQTQPFSQPLYRSTCVSWHPQLRTAGFCWSKALLPACIYWWQLIHSDQGKYTTALLGGLT